MSDKDKCPPAGKAAGECVVHQVLSGVHVDCG